jgi:hypothetical protein
MPHGLCQKELPILLIPALVGSANPNVMQALTVQVQGASPQDGRTARQSQPRDPVSRRRHRQGERACFCPDGGREGVCRVDALGCCVSSGTLSERYWVTREKGPGEMPGRAIGAENQLVPSSAQGRVYWGILYRTNGELLS